MSHITSLHFSQKAFNDFIMTNRVVGFFEEPITLASGRESMWYVNWRTISSDAYLMNQLCQFVLQYVSDHERDIDCFYGTPDGATKLAVLCQHMFAQQQDDYAAGKYPLAMGRKTPKEYGQSQDRYFVGAPSGKIIILEDVTTTGGSLLKSVQQLQELGMNVVASLALTNRNEVMDSGHHVREELQKLGVEHYSMSNALELLPLLVEEQAVSNMVKKSITTEFSRYGEQKIEL